MRRTVTAAVAFTLALSASDVGAQSTDTATALPPAEDARLADEPVAKDDPFFRSIGRDFKRFFTTTDTVRTIGVVGAGALFASHWDTSTARTVQGAWPGDAFEPGKLAGNFLTHMAAGGGTYLFGRATGHDRIARLGNDLIRAQILSQSVVHAAKLATQRDRPVGSNTHSFPSGHTATAFATAAVVQRHFGWTAGIPAYAFAGYVGASRMAANGHYLSDVILGAGVGIASAHSVTIPVGAQRFSLGVSPTPGGAAVMITKR